MQPEGEPVTPPAETAPQPPEEASAGASAGASSIAQESPGEAAPAAETGAEIPAGPPPCAEGEGEASADISPEDALPGGDILENSFAAEPGPEAPGGSPEGEAQDAAAPSAASEAAEAAPGAAGEAAPEVSAGDAAGGQGAPGAPAEGTVPSEGNVPPEEAAPSEETAPLAETPLPPEENAPQEEGWALEPREEWEEEEELPADFDSRYIWDAYNQVLYEALPDTEKKRRSWDFWLKLGACAALLILSVAGWLHGGKLLVPQRTEEAITVLQPQPSQTPQQEEAPAEDTPLLQEAVEYVPTAILVDGEAAGVLASQEAASALVEDAMSYFQALVREEEPEGEITAEVVETVSYLPAEEDAAVENYEDVFARFTGRDTPITVRCTVITHAAEEIPFDEEEEDDENLLEGTRIMETMGKAGVRAVTTYTVYDNGRRSSNLSHTDEETLEPQNRVIRIGQQEIDRSAEPGRREGAEGPETELSFQSPLPGGTIQSNFGQREGSMHLGLDYVPGEDGDAAVVASSSGTVVSLMERGAYGLLVELDHGDGFTTRYTNLAETSVQLGDSVSAGQVIGQAGINPEWEETALHFELRYRGEAYNPRQYLD